MARTSASAKPLTDHEEIRRWAEERGAKPTCVRGTGGGEDVGMIRLDFPGFTGPDKLQEISWDEWFEKFDESGLALLVQNQTARGQRSNFNKLVNRETAGISEGNGSGPKGRSRRGASSRDRNREEGYEASSGYAESDIEGPDEDLEEGAEIDFEDVSPTRTRSTRATGNPSRKARTTGRKRTRSSRTSAISSRSRSQTGRSRNQKSAKSQRSSRSRGKVAGSRSKSSATSGRSVRKKAPSRADTTGSARARGRSSSRRRAA
jgi:hypothetical protein